MEVKLVSEPQGDEKFVLARSADRRQKEKAMHDRFQSGLEAALRKMQAAAESGRLKDGRRLCGAEHNRRYADFGIMRTSHCPTAYLRGSSRSCGAHNYKPFKNCTMSSGRDRAVLRVLGDFRRAAPARPPGSCSGFQVCIQVLVRRLCRFVSKPDRDDRKVNARLEQVHRSRMPDHVRRNVHRPQRRMLQCCPLACQFQTFRDAGAGHGVAT